MAEISKIKLDGTTYDLRDSSVDAEAINKIESQFKTDFNVYYTNGEEKDGLYEITPDIDDIGYFIALQSRDDELYYDAGDGIKPWTGKFADDDVLRLSPYVMPSYNGIQKVYHKDGSSNVRIVLLSDNTDELLAPTAASISEFFKLDMEKYAYNAYLWAIYTPFISGFAIFDEDYPSISTSKDTADWAKSKFATLAAADALAARLNAIQQRLDNVAATVSKGTYQVDKQTSAGLWYDSKTRVTIKAGQSLYRVTSSPGNMFVFNSSTLEKVADLYNTAYTPTSNTTVYLGGDSYYGTDSNGTYRIKQTKTLEEALDLIAV